MEYIVEKKYFHNCSPKLRHLYVAYSLSGGMYYEAYMNIRFRYFWILFTLCTALTMASSCTIGLLQVETHNFSSLFIIGINLICVFSSIFAVSSTYYWRKTFYKFFEFLDKYDREKASNEEDKHKQDHKRTDIDTLIQKFARLVLLNGTSFLIIKLARSFLRNEFINDTFTIDFIQDYIFPFPFVKSPSPSSFFIICLIQMVAINSMALSCYSQALILYTLIISVKSEASCLKGRIKTRSTLTFDELERSFANEREIMESKVSLELKQKRLMAEKKIREKYLEEFFIELCQWIRKQQELNALIETIKGYFKAVLQIGMGLTSLFIILYGYHFRKMSSNFVEINHENIAGILTVSIILFIFCWIGNIFAEVNIDLAEELYNCPWYYLPPIKRRVFLTFLCLTQRTSSISFFGSYTVTLRLFPVIMNKIFEFVRLIWAVEMKKIKNNF